VIKVVTDGGTAPWWQWPAVDLAAAYRSGRTTPVEVLDSCLERIEVVNPQLNAFVALRRDAARADAATSAARFAAGAPLSMLDGLPLAIKDNIASADMPTVWGSPAGLHIQPVRDELVLARARALGALVVGKTNVPEFTLEGTTGNPVFGITRNPWNPALTPGGSSGGSVAAVASGMVPLALVDAMSVSIEVVDSRWAEGLQAPAWCKLADLQSHGALVLGAWKPYQAPDWAAQRCTVRIGERAVQAFRGTHALGDPAAVLLPWLRHATRNGLGLAAGSVVTTGTWCGLLMAAAGDEVQVDFDGIGSASCRF